MMKAAENRFRTNRPQTCRFNGSGLRRIFFEPKVGTRFVIVINVFGNKAMEVSLVQDDAVVEAVTAKGSPETLDVRVLPR